MRFQFTKGNVIGVLGPAMSLDGGETWSVAKTPVGSGKNSGIFSVSFSDAVHGVAIGGDFSKPEDGSANFAETSDGGKTWTAAPGPAGYRSGVLYLAKEWLTVGTSGSELGTPRAWRALETNAKLNAASLSTGAGWAVGPQGVIVKFVP